LAGSQQAVLQQRSHSNRSLMPANRSRTGVARQHVPQVGSQQAGFAQQAGSGQQALAGSQQATLAQALHSPQPPQLFSPKRRSRSSSPNPWLHRATLTRSAPKIVLLFIEQ
jgi:hypothetical protein